MLNPLSAAEVEALNSTKVEMTRAEKLERWAQVLEKAIHTIYMFHLLEHPAYDNTRDSITWPHSPMSFAAADPILADAGLKNDTIGEAKRFFELNDAQLHAFSCNCGGELTGHDMAGRIREMI